MVATLEDLSERQDELDEKIETLDDILDNVKDNLDTIEGPGLRRKKLKSASLRTKFVFDFVLVGLAIGAVWIADAEKSFVRDCGCGSGNTTVNGEELDCASCEQLNLYRYFVFSGSLVFLAPAMTSIVDFNYVTKKASITAKNVVFHADEPRLFLGMFSLGYYEFVRYDAFLLRVPVAFFNYLRLLLSFLWMWFYPYKVPARSTRFYHFCISLPGLLTPPVLVMLLFVLVREADDPAECFSYAAALQVYAHLGNWLIEQVFQRERAIGALIDPLTEELDSRGHALEYIATQLGSARRSKRKFADITFPLSPGPLKVDQTEFLRLLIECIRYFKNDVRELRLSRYAIQGAEDFDLLIELKELMNRGSTLIFDPATLNELDNETKVKLGYNEYAEYTMV